MPFELWRNDMQFAHFIIMTALSPLGVIVTVFRFVATRYSARSIGLEDWLAAAACFFFVMTNVCSSVAVTRLNGRTIEEQLRDYPDMYIEQRKWTMTAVFMYVTHATCFKLSVLALYHRIFSVKRTYRVWIYVLGVIQIIIWLVLSIAQRFSCRPFERYFDRRIPGTCTSDAMVNLAGETPNSLVDFAMVALAIAMIRSLKLSRAVRWKLSILFGLGAFVGIIGFIKVAVTYSSRDLYAYSLVATLSSFQMFISLLCCCLPVFHHLLPAGAYWEQLTSRMFSYATFGWSTRRSRNQTTERSSKLPASKRSDSESGAEGPPGGGWNPLDDGSARALTWAEAVGQTDSYVMSDNRHSGGRGGLHPMETGEPGIRVERRIDVV